MTIHKLVEKKSLIRPNEISMTLYNCESVTDAQSRLATRRGCPVSDYFVTDAEWHRLYCPAAQRRPEPPPREWDDALMLGCS